MDRFVITNNGPVEQLPESLLASMGESWRDRQAYKKHISELTASDE
jgi:hypothetical protein